MRLINKNRSLSYLIIAALVLQPIAIASSVDVHMCGATRGTLQVQSIFKPILDIIGYEYETQLRVEIAYILMGAWKDEARPWHDRNGELDEWISAVKNTPGGKKFPVDLLSVVSKPRKTVDNIEIDVKAGTGNHTDKIFTVAAKLGKDGIDDLVKNIQDPGTDKIDVFLKKPDEPYPVKIDLYAKKKVRKEDLIPPADYRNYTYQKDAKGLYRAEPIGYPGSWELDFSEGMDLVTPGNLNASINRLIKSVSTVAGENGLIGKNTSGRIYLMSDMDRCGERLAGGKYSEYSGDGIKIFVKEIDEGKEMGVFLSPGYFSAKRAYQRQRLEEALGGEKKELNIPVKEEVKPVPTAGFVGRKPKVLLFNNIQGKSKDEDIKFPAIMLASELKKRGIDITISDFPVAQYCSLIEQNERGVWPKGKPESLSDLEAELSGMLGKEYDFIGLSIYGDTMKEARIFTRELRNIDEKAVITVGGPEASLLPEHTLAHLPDVQCLVRGEGNLIFPDIVNAFVNSGNRLIGETRRALSGYEGFYLRAGGKVISSNLSSRNILGRGVYHEKKKYRYEDIEIDFSFIKDKSDVPRYLRLSTGLGCPRDCYFCGLVHGDAVRQWSPGKIIAVMKKYEERLIELGLGDDLSAGKYGLCFDDDDFFINKERAMDFLRIYSDLSREKEIHLKCLSLQTSLKTFLRTGPAGGYAPDTRLIEAIKKCANVFFMDLPKLSIGTDAFNDIEIERLNKGRPGRAYTFRDIQGVVQELDAAGIVCNHYLILTHPETTSGDITLTLKNILALIKDNKTFTISDLNFGVIPQQYDRIYQRLVENGDQARAKGTYYWKGDFWEYELLEGDAILPAWLSRTPGADDHKELKKCLGDIYSYTLSSRLGALTAVSEEVEYKRALAGLYGFYVKYRMLDSYQALWGVTDGVLGPSTILTMERTYPEFLNFMLIQNKGNALAYKQLESVYNKIVSDGNEFSPEEYDELLWLLEVIIEGRFLIVEEKRAPYMEFREFLAEEKHKMNERRSPDTKKPSKEVIDPRERGRATNTALYKEADGLVEKMKSARVNGLMNLPAIIGKYLESLPGEKGLRPINIDVDISLFRGGEENLKGDMSAWASLMLQCARLSNVSFTFDVPNPLHDGSMPEAISDIREKIPSKIKILEELKSEIYEQAGPKGIDPEKFFSERVNAARPGGVDIPICDGIWLEWLSGLGLDNPIGENQYPVVIDVGDPGDSMKVLNNYQAALSIGLAKAALAIAAGENEGPGLGFEYLATEGNILKKMNELYKLIRPEVEITMDTLRYMVSKNVRTRLNRAIELFIPPVIKWSGSVVEVREKVNLYLQAA
ncbi:MAG: cobalamin-dependent protein [Candidatus Omnitrophica bacterium]|nr:cobalamin-dependent protein [Candidatus Omnitrophota bacterium]